MFAQESVMEIQKEKIKQEFWNWAKVENPRVVEDAELGDVYAIQTLDHMFMGFAAAKAQAVPEGFVLVPEDQAKDTDRLNFLLGGEKYIRTVIHRDIQNDEYEKIGEHFQLTEVFWIDGFDYWENTSSDSERGAIDKAMLEAQEPTND